MVLCILLAEIRRYVKTSGCFQTLWQLELKITEVYFQDKSINYSADQIWLKSHVAVSARRVRMKNLKMLVQHVNLDYCIQ